MYAQQSEGFMTPPFIKYQLYYLNFVAFSAQRCRGTETFDKLTGITLRNAAQIPLFSSVGNTVTAECNNR